MGQLKSLRRKFRMVRDGWLGPLPRPEKWVFIVGCYNSGTTLLHDILASHPSIGSMPGEGQFYTDELLLPKSVGLPRLWAIEAERFRMDENSGREVNVERLKRQWGARYNDPSCPVLLEKSPTNAARTRWLQRHFENARFIGIVRNGYAVAEGIHRKAGHPLDVAALQWARSNKIMLEDFEHLERKRVLRYEDLTESPEETLKGVLAFLDLSSSEMSLTERVWEVHERKASIRNMNDESLEKLGSREREVIESKAGDLLRCLGYPWHPR
ncbi:MAG: sulfotransferase [Deltaproteobacteria bacterium]|nr:sulfotransferase [Deltaproteobacteria bacterium]